MPNDATLMATCQGRASVAFRNVLILLGRDDDIDVDLADAVPGESGIDGGSDWVSVRSAYDSHDADFFMELWSGEPPMPTAPTGAWEAVFEARMSVAGPGDLQVWEVSMGPSGDWSLRLPEPGTYSVRAFATGRSVEPDESERVPPGTELWVIQFWRVRAD